jgi:hypothetical protein
MQASTYFTKPWKKLNRPLQRTEYNLVQKRLKGTVPVSVALQCSSTNKHEIKFKIHLPLATNFNYKTAVLLLFRRFRGQSLIYNCSFRKKVVPSVCMFLGFSRYSSCHFQDECLWEGTRSPYKDLTVEAEWEVSKLSDRAEVRRAEDDNCNVCRNVGPPLTFDYASYRNPKGETVPVARI